MTEDIRWVQRFSNYKKALLRLNAAIELSHERELSDLEKQGLIQTFEFTYELAWNVIKDYYEAKGETNIQGSIDAFRLAFKRGLVTMGEALLDSVKSRRLSSHTYNEEIAEEVFLKITGSYIHAFHELENRLTEEEKRKGL